MTGVTAEIDTTARAEPGAPERARKPMWTEHGLVLRLREKHAVIDFLVSAIDGFRRHRTGRHSALMAHYGFLSVFPLFLALTTILGFVLQGNPDLADRIINSTMANIPIVGQTLSANPTALHGNVFVLIFGLGASLWAGTKAFVVTQTAMNDIWEIPEHARPSMARTRWRAVLGIGVVGASQIASSIATGLIAVSGVSWLNRVLLGLAAIVINVAALYVAYQVLTGVRLSRAQRLPGAAGAGFGFAVLQVIGTTVVSRAIARATPVYGTFASVIGLITWLSLHAMISLLGVEANAALDRRRRTTTAEAM